MKKFKAFAALIYILLVAACACDSNSPGAVVLNGAIQKGPFAQGATIDISVLNSSGVSNGQ